jgi:hypothetical protein
VYAPTKEEQENKISSNSGLKEVVFENPGKVIAKKRIPLIIGNPSKAVDLSYVSTAGSVSMRWGFKDLDQSKREYIVGADVPYITSIPSVGFVEIIQEGYRSAFLPDGRNQGPHELYISALNNKGERISFTGLPIKMEQGSFGRAEWALDFNDRKFPDRLIEFKEKQLKIESDHHY